LAVIGSSLRGFDKRATGIAIAFDYSSQQAHANAVTRAGRLASDKALDRDTFFGNLDSICVSVDSSVKEFHPGAFVGNIRVAIVLAIHQYDLPVKSLLAWASVNNSEFVSVGRHVCPDFFIENKGNICLMG
jgi:hypothetical protein